MSLMEGMGFKPRARKWIAFLAIFTFVFSFIGIADPNTAYAETEDRALHYSSIESIPMSVANEVVTLELSAYTAGVGDLITVSGTADPDVWVVIKVVDEAGNIVLFDAIKSDNEGDYFYSFKVPSVPAGILKVVAGYGTGVATKELNVTTGIITEVTLELSANKAEAGDLITVSGTADPDVWVVIKVVDEAGNIVLFDAIKSDDEGKYFYSFKVPSVPAGILKVVAGYGDNVAIGELTITEIPEPTTYTVIFSVIPEGAAVVVKDSGGTEVAAEEDGTYKLAGGEYTYTVSAEGYVTKEGTFTVSVKDETIMAALEEETAEPTITSIENIEAAVQVGETYLLSSTVIATMSDRTFKEVAVTWDPDTVDTSKAGTYTFAGTVEGYEETVILTLTVIETAVTPVTLSLSTYTAKVGDEIAASGAADPYTWISIKVVDEAGSIVFFDPTKSNAQGNYSLNFKVPDVSLGILTVVAGYSANVATGKLTIIEAAEIDKTALITAISEANTNKESVAISTNGSDVDPADKWVTQAAMTAYEEAIAVAQAVADKAEAAQQEVDEAVTALAAATTIFNEAKRDGTKEETPATYTLTLTGEGLTSTPGAGNIAENTEVTITVTAPEGKQVATFTVGGVDKKVELVDGKYTFTINADTTIEVTYEDIPTPVLQSIQVTTPPTKTTYTVGEELDLTGLVVTGTYSDGSTKVIAITVDMVSGFDNSRPGTQTLTITINGKTATYEVIITKPIEAKKDETITIEDDPVTITVPVEASGVKIDVADKKESLPLIAVQAATNVGTVEMAIPEAAKISKAPEGWDGTITLPAIKAQPGATIPNAKNVIVIEVGLPDQEITFNQAVRLVIPNQAGKDAGWIRGGKFTPITMILGEDDQKVANDEIPDEGDARIDVDEDLVIWTKHFTEFVAYEQEEKVAPAKLQADTTNNTIGQAIELTFADNADWRAAITDITVDGTSINGKYSISAGRIIIDAQVFNQAKNYQVIVKADGYKDAIITQTIKATETKRSSGGGGGTPPDKTIGKAGGTVTDYGATVTIPADAVDKDIKVKVARVSKVSDLPLPDNSKFIGNVVEITNDKSGDFKKAVTITLAFEKSKVDADKYDLSLYYLDEKANEWIELDNVKVDLKAGKVSGETNHFTRFAIIAKEKVIIDKEQPDTEDVKAVDLKDIQGHWAEKAIEELVASGAVSGYPDGTFLPNKTITRAEFSTILVKAFNLETRTGKVFNDTAGHWAKDAIAIAQAHGIVSGYSDTTFGPNDNITREQMAVMIVKATKLSESAAGKNFADSSQISTWAQKAVATASENQIITGYPDNTFKPSASATRAEAATVIVKALKLTGF